jgi:LysM repeat protein
MKVSRVACGVLLALVVAAIGLVIVLYVTRGSGKVASADPSYALITSPLNDAILFVGDPVYVRTSAMLSHRDFAGAKLLVDGQEFVLDPKAQADAPQNKVQCTSQDPKFCGSADVKLLWMGAKAGRHSLAVCLSNDAAAAVPWTVCTDAVSVVVTDLSALPPNAGTYAAQPGDTLSSVADKFGLPAAMLAAANPKVDAGKPLPKDAAVSIPGDPSLPPPSAATGSGGGPWTVATVKMSTSQPIDKGYCYYSLGLDYWTRVPAEPQTFVYPLDGKLDLTPQLRSLTIPAGGGTLAMECWGWSGATLVPLGSGKTTITPASSSTVNLSGGQFTLVATLDTIPGNFPTEKKTLWIRPPFDLTSTASAAVCTKHGPSDGIESLLWALFCKGAADKGVETLVWEWAPSIFPIDDPSIAEVTTIDGYHVYEVPAGGKPTLIKTISHPSQKALDLSFLKGMIFLKGFPTFFVRAYAGPLESADSEHFTLMAEAPGLVTVTLDPTVEHFGGQTKHKTSTPPFSSVCGVGLVLISGSPSIGPGEMAVGYDHAWPEDSCLIYNEEYSRAYVGFDLSAVKGAVDKATLTYRQGDYTSVPMHSCAYKLGVITTDPSYDLVNVLPTWSKAGMGFIEDVTSEVRNWMAGTANNGFVFVGGDETLPPDCGGLGSGCIGGATETCWTTYTGYQLAVTYFAP